MYLIVKNPAMLIVTMKKAPKMVAMEMIPSLVRYVGDGVGWGLDVTTETLMTGTVIVTVASVATSEDGMDGFACKAVMREPEEEAVVIRVFAEEASDAVDVNEGVRRRLTV